MDPETAAFWLETIAAGAAAAWFAGAWFVHRTRGVCAEPLGGEVEIPSGPDAIVQRTIAVLAEARAGSPFAGSVIEHAGRGEVRWRTNSGALRHRGVVRATGIAQQSRVVYGIEYTGRLLTFGTAFVAFGAVVIAVLFWMLRQYVLASPDAGVRAQVIQMVQAVHVLWPPFLFVGLARTLRRTLAKEVLRTLQHVPHAAAGANPA